MRRTLFCLTVAAALLLSACTMPPSFGAGEPTAAPEPSTSAEPSPEPQTTAAPAATPQAEPGLPYDEIRTIEEYDATPSTPSEGYFTMSQNGLWGLMRADGTEVLPCRSAAPVSRCGAEDHWIWFPEERMEWEEFDALSAELTEAGDGSLCPGHGGLGDMFFYDLDSPGRDTTAVDLSALRWYRMGTPGDVMEMDDTLWGEYGDILPVYSAYEEGEEGDPKFPGDPVPDDTGALYWYICKDGSAFYVPGAQQVCWFFYEELAPVQIGDKWGYVDRSGNQTTEVKYEATWGSMGEYANPEDPAAPKYAACLQNGYAAVCRGGQWGLLDSKGTEVIPCEHLGVAWEGTTLWIKSGDGWHKTELPA